MVARVSLFFRIIIGYRYEFVIVYRFRNEGVHVRIEQRTHSISVLGWVVSAFVIHRLRKIRAQINEGHHQRVFVCEALELVVGKQWFPGSFASDSPYYVSYPLLPIRTTVIPYVISQIEYLRRRPQHELGADRMIAQQA